LDDVNEEARGAESHLLRNVAVRKEGKLLLFIFVEVFKDFTVIYIFINVDHGYGISLQRLFCPTYINIREWRAFFKRKEY
jgi:hypothetical protein